MNDNGDRGNKNPDNRGRSLFPKIPPGILKYLAYGVIALVLLWGCNIALSTDPSNNIEPAQFERLMDAKLIGRDSIEVKISEEGILISGYDISEKIIVRTTAFEGDPLVKRLEEDRIAPYIDEGGFSLFGLILNFAPLIFIGFMMLRMMKSMQGGVGGINDFGRSRARQKMGPVPEVTFDDVAGIDEEKAELQEIVEFLKNPGKFLALGAHIPKGVIMEGPTGVGKTLLARAVAGEAGVPFFSIAGSEFVEMFVGVGASRVRDLFDQAKRNAPSIIFIDEIDAVGRHRGAGLGGGHDEREQTLNQILAEMDGFETSANVIVIAATNRIDILDPAILRPGRFDRRVVVGMPDIKGRKAILAVHAKGKPFEDGLAWDKIAQQTIGFSGADLANVLNEAAILTARRDKNKIGFDEISESIDRVTMGPQKKSRVISEDEKEITAYHEAGHAVCGWGTDNGDPLQKVSIISRGKVGGFTMSLPELDRNLYTRGYLQDRIVMALGGRVSESLNFHDITTGASNDLEHATSVAREMVTKYAMSDKLGQRTFGKSGDMVFLGREISERHDYSEETAHLIDQEISEIIGSAEKRAREILTKYKDKVKELAEALLDKETLEADDLVAILGPKPTSND